MNADIWGLSSTILGIVLGALLGYAGGWFTHRQTLERDRLGWQRESMLRLLDEIIELNNGVSGAISERNKEKIELQRLMEEVKKAPYDSEQSESIKEAIQIIEDELAAPETLERTHDNIRKLRSKVEQRIREIEKRPPLH